MTYTFESYNTELTPRGLTLPKELFETDSVDVMVYPSPYMTVRISNEEQFSAAIGTTEKLPKRHRQMILRLMYAKAFRLYSQRDSDMVYNVIRELSSDKDALFKSGNPIPVHVENCGEYIQITVL